MTDYQLNSSDNGTADYPGVSAGTSASLLENHGAGTFPQIGQGYIDAGTTYFSSIAFIELDTPFATVPVSALLRLTPTNWAAGVANGWSPTTFYLVKVAGEGTPITVADWKSPAELTALIPSAAGSFSGDDSNGTDPFDVTLDPSTFNLGPGAVTRYIVFTDTQAAGTSPGPAGANHGEDGQIFGGQDATVGDRPTLHDLGVGATATASLFVVETATPFAFPPSHAGSPGVLDTTPDAPYTVRVVDMVGNVITELTGDPADFPEGIAEPGDITETLNAPDTFDIHFPKGAFTRAQVPILGTVAGAREVQILLGSKVLAWGPLVSGGGQSGPDGSIKLSGAGPDFYFTKRNVDEEPIQLLHNPGFEDDFDGWTNDDPTHITPSIVTSPVIEGSKAASLFGFSTDPTLWIRSSRFSYTTGRHARRLTYTVSFILESFVYPALYNGGILIEASPPGPGGRVVGGVNAKGTALYNIDETTPLGVEVRPSLDIVIPAHTTWRIQVLLFCPGIGQIIWDAGYFVANESLSTVGLVGPDAAIPTVDVSHIVSMLIANVTTAALGKSDLHIGLTAPAIGVKLARSYAFTDHVGLDEALREFIDRDDCFDYSMAYTATTRRMVLYPIATGPAPAAGRGVDRSGTVTLTFGTKPFLSYTGNVDGAGTVTQAAELGDGSGASREERWNTAAGRIGGTILQGTFNAPANTPLSSLKPLARAATDQLGEPAEIVEVTIDRTPGGDSSDPTVILQDLLEVGDIVTADIVDGWNTYEGTFRIVQRVRHCRARTMTYTLNRIVLV